MPRARLAAAVACLIGCGSTAGSTTSPRPTRQLPVPVSAGASVSAPAVATVAPTVEPTATPPPPPVPDSEPPLIEGMRSRIARGDTFFPDLDNGCTDAHGYWTTPLWDEARLTMVLPSKLAERRVKRLATQAVAALAQHNYAVLAKQVDARGLCMRAAKGGLCVQLAPTDVRTCRQFFHDDWDIDSGKDGPWPGTCHEMVDDVFMAQDFTKATSISFSCFSGLRGNNGSSILMPDMPTTAYAEFFFMPKDELDGLSWRALRLGYDTAGPVPKLVEIVSEYWGI